MIKSKISIIFKLGVFTLVMLMQPENAPSPIFLKFGKIKFVRLMQLEKEFFPIVSRFSIFNICRFSQPLKASSLILLICCKFS